MINITILGSGGARRIPRACCQCEICKEARVKGRPYERLGAAMFIEDNNILFETPEDINTELNNENIKKVEHIFFSHWHPDHTAGMRVIESIGNKNLKVYLTEQLKKEEKLKQLFYLEQREHCKIIIGSEFKINDMNIKILSLENKFANAFIVSDETKKLVICPCHCMHLPIKEELKNADVLIMNLGFFGEANDSTTGFEKDNLRLIKALKPKKTVLMHIEESFHKNYDEYCQIEKQHKNLLFAFDGMKI